MSIDFPHTGFPGGFRRYALGSCGTPRDPTAYAAVEVRMECVLTFLEEAHARSGQRLTLTHVVAKAAADALQRYPEANTLLRFNRPFQRRHVTVSVLVIQAGERDGGDLTIATVHAAEEKPLLAFAAELEGRVAAVRARKDAAIEWGKRSSLRIPAFLLPAVLRLLSFTWFTLNLDLQGLGLPRDPFGSVAVTNVGTLGLERAFPALAGYTRVPLLLVPGAVREEPVVEGSDVVLGKVMTLGLTFDARLIDLPLAAQFLAAVKECLEAPGG